MKIIFGILLIANIIFAQGNAFFDSLLFGTKPYQLTEAVKSEYINQSWQPYSRYVYSFYPDGNLESAVDYFYESSTWVKSDKETRFYNTNGNRHKTLYYFANGEEWLESRKDSIIFNEENKPLLNLHFQNSEAGWILAYRDTFIYDLSNNLTEEILQFPIDTTWFDNVITHHYYDSLGNPSERLTERWDGEQWSNYYKMSFQFNEGKLTDYYSFSFDGPEPQWLNEYWNTLFYDENGNPDYLESKRWNETSWDMESRTAYNYDLISTIEENSFYPETLALKAFPNPFNPSFTLQFTNSNVGYFDINIFNTSGQIVKNIYSGNLPSGDHSFKLNGQNWSSGIYFIKVRGATIDKTLKVTLLK
ncbi:MAG: T9SS C-terminal target domain-containing protein [Calditrichaeota bacterium]|nr:MAG: T9SS C-terminal target domain-containing protein [Calditrichota bacterium]MBL1206135.1 T9SS C-terminal target domain-containing protein [Calditrichota bacterium]NOG45960.1 T9SS type A sorting domain-containing protein [Calditrichota bacterium]